VCGNCGAFDSLSWTAPGIDELHTLPGAPHDERLAADAAHAFIASAPEDSYVTPRIGRRKIKIGEPAFVEIPRPPDDPGPGGHELFEAEN